jgi:hypothetical protein
MFIPSLQLLGAHIHELQVVLLVEHDDITTQLLVVLLRGGEFKDVLWLSDAVGHDAAPRKFSEGLDTFGLGVFAIHVWGLFQVVEYVGLHRVQPRQDPLHGVLGDGALHFRGCEFD